MRSGGALRIRTFWQIQIIGWSCFYIFDLVESIHQLLTKRVHIDEETVPIVFMFLASCALRPICRRLRSLSQSWIDFEAKAAAVTVILALPGAGAACLILGKFYSVPWHALVTVWAWSAFVLFIWCSLYFSIKQWQQSVEETERLLRAESEVRKARLLALRYQLNPHFLFNALNSVSTLIMDGNGPAAKRMLAQIGDLLRVSLDSEASPEVPLSQELAFTEGYLAIEQTRFGDRLKVEMSVPWQTRDALVPNMLLQPLVENAVRYGVAPLVEGGRVSIRSAFHADRLQIVVGNSGRRDASEQRHQGSGIGLANTAERLKTLYGPDGAFSLKWPETGGCEVVLELPVRMACGAQEATSCVL